MSLAYRPQTDGRPERTNQTIGQMLRCAPLRDEGRWAEILPILGNAYNSMQHSSTESAPFDFLYGFIQSLGIPTKAGETALPLQVSFKSEEAKRQLERAQRAQKRHADKIRREVNYAPRQQVWLKATRLPDDGSSKALREWYDGP